MTRLLNSAINYDSTEIPKAGAYQLFFKRAMDIIIVILMAPIAFVIIIPLAVITSFDGSGPFYWQKRIGFHGRIFYMLKLRSMVPNAENLLNRHLLSDPAAKREWDIAQKLKNDPRITKLGRFIRKTSIDELPQLWNVFKGEMSIVGPRPIMQNQRKIYPGYKYFEMRPGITGFWQVSERNECSFSKRAHFDAEYYNKQSFLTDLIVMLKTVKVVMRATGV